MHIQFWHTKTEQDGMAKRTKCAIYSNINEPYIDIPFLLGLYLSRCFNNKQQRGLKLFPRTAASNTQRISRLLQKVMKENEPVVRSLGILKLIDICVHSIRKGVSTYLASLPGGPSPAALSLRGGWSMGQVRDIYFQHSQGGDEHAGRCASMLNMMSDSFACFSQRKLVMLTLKKPFE